MLIKNVFFESNENVVDIRIKEGKFLKIEKEIMPLEGEEVLDCTGNMILPPFVESHVHLDTCLTAGEPSWNISGTLFEGISIWEKRKQSLTKNDIKNRAIKAIKMYGANGVQHIRTHVDVTDPSLVAIEAMLEVKDEVKDFANLQIVAFPQDGIMSFPNGKELVEQAVRMGVDCIGAIPHYEFTREYSVESLNYIVKLAEKYDKLIDVHCDEIDDEQSRGLETLACRAYETGLKNRVTASHTTAMHSYNNAYCSKLFRLLELSDINFVANPLVNTHLQGRIDTYPKRRGVTRVKELLENGNNVSFGHDDIYDPWYPMGSGDMTKTVFMGLHVCHLMGYDEINQSHKFITYNGAKTLNLGEGYGIKEGNKADFIIIEGKNFHTALSNNVNVLYSYKNGKQLLKSTPIKREIMF